MKSQQQTKYVCSYVCMYNVNTYVNIRKNFSEIHGAFDCTEEGSKRDLAKKAWQLEFWFCELMDQMDLCSSFCMSPYER